MSKTGPDPNNAAKRGSSAIAPDAFVASPSRWPATWQNSTQQ